MRKPKKLREDQPFLFPTKPEPRTRPRSGKIEPPNPRRETFDQALARRPAIVDPTQCWRCASGNPPVHYGMCALCMDDFPSS
jgi:hypothetical protein